MGPTTLKRRLAGLLRQLQACKYKDKVYKDRNCRNCRNSYERIRNASKPKVKKHWLEGKTEDQKLELRKKKSAKRRYARYGLSLENLKERLEAQHGHCATCFTLLTLDSFSEKEETVKPAHVDHDHSTGKVRGILCSKCNHALGLVNDDVKVLKAMISYLKEYTE